MIAITSTGNKLKSLMDMRFAKCTYFCFLKETGSEFIRNPFQDAERHIAPEVVDWLKLQGITQVITGEIGSFAQKSLKEAHIQVVLIDNNNYTVQGIMNKIGWDDQKAS
ncbi:MAG: NifB/NifX family molybdenum-iron cluster-binding protein [Paludibacter sp.]